jgi:hypothetical protein
VTQAENWKHTPPFELAGKIERAKARIPFHPGWDQEFVLALAQVKRAVPKARWRRILTRLAPGLPASCDGGPDWDPRVLANGGLAIRNFHRVLALDLEHGASVKGIEPAVLRREVRTVLRRGEKADESATLLLHHGPGGIVYLRRVPAGARFHGQSILFTPVSLLSDLKVLGARRKRKAREEQMAAIRLFQDTACFYSLYRHADEADTIVESFALSRFDRDFTFSTAGLLPESNNLSQEFLKWVEDQVDGELPGCGVPKPIREDLRALMTSDDPGGWAAQILAMLRQFPPLFAKDPGRPPDGGH